MLWAVTGRLFPFRQSKLSVIFSATFARCWCLIGRMKPMGATFAAWRPSGVRNPETPRSFAPYNAFVTSVGSTEGGKP